MENKFTKHFFVIGGGTIVNMLLSLLITPIITRIVNPIEYGQYSIFTMYSGIAVMVLCMGLDQTLVRFFYEKESIEYKRALLFRCIKFPILFSIFFGIIAIVVSVHFAQFKFNTTIMACFCVYVLAQVIYRFSLLVVRLEYKSKLFSILKIINKASYIVVVIPLLIIFKNSHLFMLVLGLTIAELICLFVSIFTQSNIWNIKKYNSSECIISQRELMTYALPFIVSMSVTTLFQAIDKIALNYYCTYSEVGIYSSTMTLVQVFAIIQTTFNTLWAPMQVEHYSKEPNDHTFYQKGNRVITVIMFFIGVSLILVKDIFAILLGAQYREAAYILPFLIFNPIMYTISETTVGGLVFMKKSKMQVVVAVGACVANIIGNMILVPRLGCQGAAISTGIAYIVFFSLRTIISNRYYYTDFRLKRFYSLTVIVGIYAFYNTFYKFGIMTVIGYIGCLTALTILYHDTVKWIISYIKTAISKWMKI